jgi:hypothetical protein
MKTNIKPQLDRYKELAGKVCSYTDKVQKRTALESLLAGIKGSYS